MVAFDTIYRMFDDHEAVFGALRAEEQNIALIADLVVHTLELGRKIYICGNGGSASQADHFAGEIVGRFATERRALPAIALTVSPAVITAISNDYGFDEVFARQLEGLGQTDDLLIAISTSGQSPNVLRAATVARERGMSTVALTGNGGGPLAPSCDAALIVASNSTAQIQEMHILVIHIICGVVDATFTP